MSVKNRVVALREALLEWKVLAHFIIDVVDTAGFARAGNMGEEALKGADELVEKIDKLDSVVRSLAKSDPLYDEAIQQPDKSILWNTTCALCCGEIPNGHAYDCPWWVATQYVRENPA